LGGHPGLVGVTVFFVMQRHAEELLSKSLQSSLKNRVQLTQTEIGTGFDRTMLVATRPLLIDQVQRVNTGADDGGARAILDKAAQTFLPTGLTAIAVFDKDGRELARAGTFTQKSTLTVPLNLPGRVQLMWDGQLLLHAVVDMKQAGQVVGKVMTETSLPATTGAFKEAHRLGETGEMALCALFGLNMQCFPTTLNPNVMTLSQRSPKGNLLPMAHALAGKTGIVTARDYRHQEVVAAYAPVGDLGLGMVLKMDGAELYAPVWRQLRFLIPLLLGVLIIALLSLRWLLTPLVRRLVRSEAEAAQRTAELTKEIAEHRQTEAETLRFKNILDNTLDMIFMFEPESLRFVYLNQGAVLSMGYSREELLGMTPCQIKPLVPEPQFRQLIAPLLSGEQPSLHFDTLHRRKDGTDFPVDIALQLMRERDGSRLFVAIVRDITERKKAEKELLAESKKNEALLQAAGDGIHVLDLDGNLVQVNAAFSHMLGYTPKEMIGMNVAQWDAEWEAEPEEVRMRILDQMGSTETFETRHRHRDGHIFDVEVNVVGVEIGGNKLLFCAARDITERKHYERSLQEARDKAELATRSKGQFLANMSHEIRTPMNAILGMLTLLEKSTLSAQQDDYVSKTKGAAHSLLGLLNDILDLSKVEAGKMTLDPQPFRLDRMLRDLAVILSAYGGGKPVEVLYDIDPALPEVVRGDAQRLQQVLINLAGNAVKFTAQGEVIVRLQLVQANADTNTVRIAFAVQDSGIGIASENQAHIFSGFSQAEASTTRQFGGTGLGLSISQQLVALMGGTITLTSALGQGSIFAFELELPLITHASEIPAKRVVPSMASAATLNVLVIDDNAAARRLTAKMTQAWQWPTDTAAGGAEALERIRERHERSGRGSGGFPYQVVYVDWKMPGMDGWETARRVRALSDEMGGARPVIVMLSSHTRESLTERTSEEQALLDGFLVKPVTASMLQEAALGTESATHRLREARRAGGHARRLTGMRILVVEDNLINQQVAEELLMSEGALVSMAANGQLGVDAVAAAHPQFDVVLMDIQMPVMDGYTATQTIRNRLGLSTLPIVAMTANAMASDREECLAAGMTEHVGKPFDLPKLVQLLLRLTGGTGHTGLPVARDAGDAGDGPQHKSPNTLAPGGEIDVQGAIHRMSGLETLYLRSAKEFVKELAHTVAQWQAALPHNPHQAVMQMHTLKGTAALLGATRLSNEAARLEKLCHAPLTDQACAEQTEPLRRVVRTTQDALQAVIDEMAVRLASRDDAPPRVRVTAGAPAVDTPALQETLYALMALLEASNLQALELFAQRRTDFDGVDEAQFSQLEEALQSLELEPALVICRAMAQGAGWAR
jgi:two-component system sensor histidine kinase/response regulator